MFGRWKCPRRRADVLDRAIWAHAAVLVRRSRVSLLFVFAARGAGRARQCPAALFPNA